MKSKKCVVFLTVVALVFSVVIPVMGSHIIKAEAFKSKLVYGNAVYSNFSLESMQEEEIPRSVSVVLEFENGFVCDCDENGYDEIEDVYYHREEMKNYFSALNSSRAAELGLSDYSYMHSSSYAPIIAYTYDNYDSFMEHDYALLENKNPEYLLRVHIQSEYKFENAAVRGLDNQEEYPFSDVLSDVGIPSNNTYTGSGIKIGILEMALPSNLSNLTGVTYQMRDMQSLTAINSSTELTEKEHAFEVYSVIGGTSGVARGAELFMSTFENVATAISAVEWFIDCNVNIINASSGTSNGTYDVFAQYIDYISTESKIVVVGSAGNISPLIMSPSIGVNVICVTSTDVDGRISKTAAKTVNSAYDSVLLKPTIAAPGGKITGIQNISGSLSGTSYSAPIVTGIVALLMERIPMYKTNPQFISSVLTSTCTPVIGQNGVVDSDAGFGLVNYGRAISYGGTRQALTLSNGTTAGTLFSKSVYVPAGSKIVAVTNIKYNSYATGLYTQPVTPEYSTIKPVLRNRSTGATVVNGTVDANYGYLVYENNTSSGIYYNICVDFTGTKQWSGNEDIVLSYHVEDIPDHVHRYVYNYIQDSTNVSRHYAYCECGSSISEAHSVVNDPNVSSYLYCRECLYITNIMVQGIGGNYEISTY